MKKTINKILSALLFVAILLSIFSISAFAQSMPYTNAECQKIVTALKSIESVKNQMDLASVNFSDIGISSTIKTYNYTSEGLVFNTDFVALKSDGKLVAWAIKLIDNQDTLFQISTAYIKEINAIINDKTNFALIYDYNSCYLYDGMNVYHIGDISLKDQTRAIINSVSDIKDVSNAELHSINSTYSIEYNQSRSIASENNVATSYAINTSAPIYYECGVKFVSQNPPSNICWAASIACIVNYRKRTSYTAIRIAKNYYGNDYNQKLICGYEDDILNAYGLAYTYKGKVPSDGVILKNIKNYYPVLSTFKWSRGKDQGCHDTVIYGINVIGGYLYVMDPEHGFCSASASSSGYTYISGWSGVKLTLCMAACRYWTA